MIDIKFLRENPDVVKENIKKKFQDHKLPCNLRFEQATPRRLFGRSKNSLYGEFFAPSPRASYSGAQFL